MGKKIVIVGGVAGGASVAARARRLDEQAEIIVFERGPHPSFSNCCLPNFLSREIEDSEDLLLMSPEQFKAQYNIVVRVLSEVIKILPEEKKVLVKELSTGREYEEGYDELVLSPGANAILPKSIVGIDRENVFVVKNVPDIRRLDDYIHAHNVNDIVVVGGGFIGLEVMENLRRAGRNVSLVEAFDQVMAPLDYDMSQILNKEIYDNGVELILSDAVTEIQPDKVILKSGREIKSGLVVMAIGVAPETSLAKDCGIELGVTGAIKVDHNYMTSKAHIYAVGDVIETHNFITMQTTKLPLAGPAQKQARAVADHIYGRSHRNKGVVGSAIIKVFDMNAAATGLNEKACKAANIDYRYSYVIPADKVGIMPGAKPMFFKLVFEYPSGRILGAQAVGGGNVDKRIDIIAALIQMNGTLEDLKEMEFCYAPAFSTAKDVTNHAALVGLNVLYGEIQQVPVSKVRELVENNEIIIDVREDYEFKRGHLINAINIPLSQFRERMGEIPKDKPVYLHCRSSQRSYNALRALIGSGYTNVYNIQGSYIGISYYEFFNDKVTGRKPIVTEYNFK